MRNCREKKEEVGDLWLCIETYLLLGILVAMKLLEEKTGNLSAIESSKSEGNSSFTVIISLLPRCIWDRFLSFVGL